MRQYIDLINDVIDNGNHRTDRTGVGTISVFGRQVRYDLRKGFPLLTTKKMFLKGIIHELLWFLNGDTNIKYLLDNNVHIWDEWANETGDLGPIYGAQLRSWKGKVIGLEEVTPTSNDGKHIHMLAKPVRENIDQIKTLIHNLKTNPFSRRHVISCWNVEDLPDEKISPQENVANGKMALAPCHCLFQFYVEEVQENGVPLIDTLTGKPRLKLSCQLYQRSCDALLGMPFNIASYALLTMMVARCVDMYPGEFIHTFGDLHVYKNHVATYKLYQQHNTIHPSPVMVIDSDVNEIDQFVPSDFVLMDYPTDLPRVSYDIAV